MCVCVWGGGGGGWGCLFSQYIYIENLKKSSCQKSLERVQCNLAGNVAALVTFYQECSSPHDTSKNMATRGRAWLIFPLYRRL